MRLCEGRPGYPHAAPAHGCADECEKIRRLMWKYHVCPIQTSNPYRRLQESIRMGSTAGNLVNREFESCGPRAVLLMDIPYIPLKGKSRYLSTIPDSCTKHYVLSESLEVDFFFRRSSVISWVFQDRSLFHTFFPQFLMELLQTQSSQIRKNDLPNMWFKEPISATNGVVLPSSAASNPSFPKLGANPDSYFQQTLRISTIPHSPARAPLISITIILVRSTLMPPYFANSGLNPLSVVLSPTLLFFIISQNSATTKSPMKIAGVI